jgi:DNA-binding LytR/AlgR family response regulator
MGWLFPPLGKIQNMNIIQLNETGNKQNVTNAEDYTNSAGRANSGRDYFFIKNDSSFTKVFIKDILWIEALGNYIAIRVRSQRFVLHITLKSVEERLPVNKFIRVHRSYIVNIDNIRFIEDTTVYLDELHIPIGALYKRNFIKHLNTLQ